MKRSLFRKPRAPTKARPKKPNMPLGSDMRMPGATPQEIEDAAGGPLDEDSYPPGTRPPPIEPVNAPLYPAIGDLYPHLDPDQRERSWRGRPMPPVTKCGRREMRIHDVIRVTAAVLERRGEHSDVDAILAQFPDIDIGGDQAPWDMAQRIEDAFAVQLSLLGDLNAKQ